MPFWIYNILMRKKVALSITCVVMVCVLLASLTSCMKIGMKQNAIESRLKESGATISYERTTPITKEAKGMFSKISFVLQRCTRALLTDKRAKSPKSFSSSSAATTSLPIGPKTLAKPILPTTNPILTSGFHTATIGL